MEILIIHAMAFAPFDKTEFDYPESYKPLEDLIISNSNTNLIVLGDFNTEKLFQIIPRIEGSIEDTITGPTTKDYYEKRGEVHIDYIMINKNIKCFNTDKIDNFSDHYIICANLSNINMDVNLKELYKEIEKKEINDFDILRDYYINLLKEKNILNLNQELNDINEYKSLLLKKEEPCNIRGLWYFIEKKYNKKMSWIEHPLIFSFNNELKSIEDSLTNKAKEIGNEYIDCYYNSPFFNELKRQIIELLKMNRTGIDINKMYKYFDNISKSNIDKAINILKQEETIKKLEGSNPAIYYV